MDGVRVSKVRRFTSSPQFLSIRIGARETMFLLPYSGISEPEIVETQGHGRSKDARHITDRQYYMYPQTYLLIPLFSLSFINYKSK